MEIKEWQLKVGTRVLLGSLTGRNFANKSVDLRQFEESLTNAAFPVCVLLAVKSSHSAICTIMAEQTEEIRYPAVLTIIVGQSDVLVVFVF